MSVGTLRRVSVRVARERSEEARALMLELFPEGFEETDHRDDVELAAYTTSRGEERLWEAFGPGAVREVEPGWESAWKRFHRPVRVGPLWVGPPWETPDPESVPVVIEPGLAFGTGAHPTTRLCLELLLQVPLAPLVDVGCGSGVLAIAAAKLGFEPVWALDVEEEAVAATRQNAAANGVLVTVLRGDARREPIPPAPVATANITRAEVEELAGRIPAGTLVTSGYLSSEQPRLPGWEAVGRVERGGWAADRLRRS